MPPSSTTSQGHNYYPGYRTPLLISSFFLMIVSAVTFILLSESDTAFTRQGVFPKILLILGILSGTMALSSKVVLSESHVVLCFLGLQATTSWANIRSFEIATINGISAPVLRLRLPADLVWCGYSVNHLEQLMHIPLPSYNLQPQSPLYQAVKQNAAHLFR